MSKLHFMCSCASWDLRGILVKCRLRLNALNEECAAVIELLVSE
jgi:hypothetical protein